jgi:hypothetical protein
VLAHAPSERANAARATLPMIVLIDMGSSFSLFPIEEVCEELSFSHELSYIPYITVPYNCQAPVKAWGYIAWYLGSLGSKQAFSLRSHRAST